jgi:hypothetical protein
MGLLLGCSVAAVCHGRVLAALTDKESTIDGETIHLIL